MNAFINYNPETLETLKILEKKGWVWEQYSQEKTLSGAHTPSTEVYSRQIGPNKLTFTLNQLFPLNDQYS